MTKPPNHPLFPHPVNSCGQRHHTVFTSETLVEVRCAHGVARPTSERGSGRSSVLRTRRCALLQVRIASLTRFKERASLNKVFGGSQYSFRSTGRPIHRSPLYLSCLNISVQLPADSVKAFWLCQNGSCPDRRLQIGWRGTLQRRCSPSPVANCDPKICLCKGRFLHVGLFSFLTSVGL